MISRHKNNRKGAVAVLLCLLLVPLLALLAFSIDYGFLLYIKSELQRSVDQAAVAAARDLMPDQDGNQDFEKARATVKEYVRLNMGAGFTVHDSDIEFGRYNPNTIYGKIELLNSGTYDTVRVTISRDSDANGSVALYFARLFDTQASAVSATSTAVLQKARYLGPGTSVFPFAIDQRAWKRIDQGEEMSIYGDGRIKNEAGQNIPGNWGTVDIGPQSNSTSDLSAQMRNGLSQSDLNSLNTQGATSSSDYIDATTPITLNGDTGLSSGLKHALEDVRGTMKVAPIFKQTSGKGGSVSFDIIGWVTVEVVDASFNGSKNSRVVVKKSFTYDGSLLPVNDLSDTSNVIEGAYTSPVLVQ